MLCQGATLQKYKTKLRWRLEDLMNVTIVYRMSVRLISLFFLVFLCACATKPQTNVIETESLGVSKRDQNKAVVRKYMDVRWSSNYRAVRAQTHSENYKEIRNEFENLSYNVQDSELESLSDSMRAAFPDRKEVVEVIVGEGNVVGVKYKIFATHLGNFYGIPATGKAVEIDSTAIFRIENGKIIEGWFMADEVALLRQLDMPMPERADGIINIPPTIALTSDLASSTMSGDELLQNLLDNPVDSRNYRNKIKVAARRAKSPPPGIIPAQGRPYGKILRYGFGHFVDIGTKRGALPNNFGAAFPDRINLIPHLIIDGDWGMINFRVTGTNTVGLYDLPATNKSVDAWEVSFMQFDNEVWSTAWFFGDDMGLLRQLGHDQDFFFPEDLDFAPLDNPQH